MARELSEFGRWLDAQAKARGFTRAELAGKANVTPSALTHVLYGDREVGVSMLIGLAYALDVSPVEILSAMGVYRGRITGDDDEISAVSSIMRSWSRQERQEVLRIAVAFDSIFSESKTQAKSDMAQTFLEQLRTRTVKTKPAK